MRLAYEYFDCKAEREHPTDATKLLQDYTVLYVSLVLVAGTTEPSENVIAAISIINNGKKNTLTAVNNNNDTFNNEITFALSNLTECDEGLVKIDLLRQPVDQLNEEIRS